MTLGERIASLRKERNLSQEGLGELVGVSRQAVSKWEADRALPDVNNCVAMSRALGISLEELLDLEEASFGGKEELTEDQIHIVEKMIDKYTNAQRRVRSRLRWPLILVGCLLAIGVAWLWQWLSEMNRTIDYLHGEIAGLRSEIISGVSDQLQTSLTGEKSWEADYVTRVKQVDLKNDQITYMLEVEFTEPILIYQLQFMIRQETEVWMADMKSQGGLRWGGEITCPIRDHTELYMITEEDNGTVHREKVAVWHPEERYTLYIDGWVRGDSADHASLALGETVVSDVYVSGFSHGYDSEEWEIPLQMTQAEVVVLQNQDIVSVQSLDLDPLNMEETTGNWFFQSATEIELPDHGVETGDLLTLELRVMDSYDRSYTRVIRQYQVQQDGEIVYYSAESNADMGKKE